MDKFFSRAILALLFGLICTVSCQNQKKVAIIGAGMSGLSAANELVRNGFTDFVVLEAEDRVGGRINTIQYNGLYIDLGAQFVTGFEDNPIYDLALEIKELSNITLGSRFLTASSDGKIVSEELMKELEKHFEKIKPKIYDDIKNVISRKMVSVSLESIIRNRVSRYVQTLRQRRYQHLELFNAYVKRFVSSIREEYAYNKDFSDLSPFNDVSDDEELADDNAVLNRGFSSLINHLYSKIPSESVLLGHEVKNINWKDDDGKVIISVLDKEQDKTVTYSVDAVLVTTSLGYLKHNHRRLFTPSLPRYKINSLNNLDFGVITKLFIEFEQPLGSALKDAAGLRVLWRNSNNLKFKFENSKCNIPANNKFYEAFSSFYFLSDKPNFLLILVPGREGIFLETYDNECLVSALNQLFAQLYPTTELPEVTNVIKSGWFNNQYQKGSYGFIRTGGSYKDIENYAKPIKDKIYFSGDLTNDDHYGFTQGARISGIDAAKEIIEALKSN